MRRGMRNLRGLKARCFTSHMIDLNECLDVLPGSNMSDKICKTDINDFIKTVCPKVRAIRRMFKDFIFNLLL